MTGYLGVDVSKAGLDVVLLREDRRESQHFTNTPTGFGKLHGWVQRRLAAGQVHACLEATGHYSEAIAEYLVEQGYQVSVVNPLRIKGYADSQLRRNKTDRLDAALIAEFCRSQQPPTWTPLPPEIRQLQALVRHLEDLTATLQQARNRLDNPAQAAPVTDHLQAQIALLHAQLKQTKQAISDHLNQHPHLKQQADLLRSIPGLGDLTIGKLLAECRDPSAFHNVRQLVAFAGLNPRQHSSGSSIHFKATISRTGSASLRAALYMPAVVALRCNPVLSAFADRLPSRGVPGRAIVAVMRKLLHLVFGVIKSNRPFDPNFQLAS